MRFTPRPLVFAFLVHLASLGLSQTPADISSILAQQATLKARWQAEIDANRPPEAMRKAQDLAALERKLLSLFEQHPQGGPDEADRVARWNQCSHDLEATLDWIAESLEDEDEERAFPIRQEVIVRTEARLARDHELRILELSDESRTSLSSAETLEREGQALFQAQDQAGALSKLTESWQLFAQVLGQDDARTLQTRAWIPYLIEQRGDYAEAARWLEEELAILEQTLGWNIKTAKSTHRLATAYNLSGELGKAKSCYQQSLDIRLRVVGDEHRDTAIAHTALGLIYMWTGDYAAAKPQLVRSHEIVDLLPPDALASAANLQNLALLHAMMGDFARAEPLYQHALVHALAHPSARAQILDNMGLMFTALGNHEEGERHYQQALAAYEAMDAEHLSNIIAVGEETNTASDQQLANWIKLAKPNHRQTLLKIATTQNNLAWLYTSIDENEKAERLFQRSLAISRAVGGENRPQSAACLDNLGRLHEVMGELALAQQEFEQALAIRNQVLGANHIETAVSKSNLGLLKLSLGDQAAAQPLLRECLDIRRRLLDESATVQNERQQLLMNQGLRSALDDWLSVVDDESTYAEVLRWKGAIFMRQAGLRALRQQPELMPLVDQLRSVSSRFAKLSLTAPADEHEHHQQLQELGDQRDQIETQLAEQSQAYRRSRDQASLTPIELQSVIAQSDKTALVDYLQYDRIVAGTSGPDQQPLAHHLRLRERRFVAFVVLGEGQIHRVELGSANVIDRLVDDYRQNQLQDEFAYDAAISKSAEDLRKILWQPLEQYLDGMETVLISPDACLGKLPFCALPGKETGTYLLEDYATVVIPVPQALPLLLGRMDIPEVEGELLVLGGVNYDLAGVEAAKPKGKFGKFGRRSGEAEATPTRNLSANYATRLSQYVYLPATKSELNDIRDIFEAEAVSVLTATLATEEAFRLQASKNRYLHLATHGFFAPEGLMSAFAARNDVSRGSGVGSGFGDDCQFIGHNPGLLSGLVLAGANNPTVDGDDGVLTALEVADIDLAGVELAVLSACETGLGRVAGGEGLLGLQRSFQVAGARSVVASLWKVNDDKTSALMRDFYNNLWNIEMGKLQALHQTQLAMLNSKDRGVRKVKSETESTEKRTPPYFWAAFVLSGDWHADWRFEPQDAGVEK